MNQYGYPQQNLMQQAQVARDPQNQNHNQMGYNYNAYANNGNGNGMNQQQQLSYPPPQPPMPMQQPPPVPQQQMHNQPQYQQQQQQQQPQQQIQYNNQNQYNHPLAPAPGRGMPPQTNGGHAQHSSHPMARGPYIDPETQIAYPCANPDFEGWLTKQSMWLKDWRRRYFLLSGSKLFFAKNAFSAPHGMIDLSTATTVKSADVKSRKKNSFEVSTHDMTYLMYADTEKEKDDWIGSVGRSIVRASGTFLTKNDVKGAGSATRNSGSGGALNANANGGSGINSAATRTSTLGGRGLGGYGNPGVGHSDGYGYGDRGDDDDDDYDAYGDGDDGVFENSDNHPYFND